MKTRLWEHLWVRHDQYQSFPVAMYKCLPRKNDKYD